MDNNNYNGNYNNQNYADPAYNNYNNQNYADPAYNNYNNPAYYGAPGYNVAPPKDTSGSALTFGILSLVFCGLGILGLIFAIIGKSNAKKYAANFGQPSGKSKTGSILSTIGLIFSILSTVWYVIYIAIIIIAAISGSM